MSAGAIRLRQGTAPDTPPTGYVSFYAKTDGSLYIKLDDGTELQISLVAGANAAKENFTLDSTDIANQYITLSDEATSNSVILSFNGLIQQEGSDYSLSTVLGVTRITFLGSLATGGQSELMAGDVLNVQYQR